MRILCDFSIIPSRTRPGSFECEPRRTDAHDTRRSSPRRLGISGGVAHGASRSLHVGVEATDAEPPRILRQEEKRAPMLLHDREEARLSPL